MKTPRFAFALCALLALVPPAGAQAAGLLSDFATARPVVAVHGMVVSQEATAHRP